MTPGGPLGAVYAPLVVRFRPGHLMGTIMVDISSLKTTLRRFGDVTAKLPAKTGDFWVLLKNRLLWPVCSSSVKIWSGLVISHNLA